MHQKKIRRSWLAKIKMVEAIKYLTSTLAFSYELHVRSLAYTGRLYSKGLPFLRLGIYTWIFETPGWQKYQLILLVGNLKQ